MQKKATHKANFDARRKAWQMPDEHYAERLPADKPPVLSANPDDDASALPAYLIDVDPKDETHQRLLGVSIHPDVRHIALFTIRELHISADKPLIIQGDHPVLIQAETITHEPNAKVVMKTPALFETQVFVADTENPPTYDYSGLDGAAGAEGNPGAPGASSPGGSGDPGQPGGIYTPPTTQTLNLGTVNGSITLWNWGGFGGQGGAGGPGGSPAGAGGPGGPGGSGAGGINVIVNFDTISGSSFIETWTIAALGGLGGAGGANANGGQAAAGGQGPSGAVGSTIVQQNN